MLKFNQQEMENEMRLTLNLNETSSGIVKRFWIVISSRLGSHYGCDLRPQIPIGIQIGTGTWKRCGSPTFWRPESQTSWRLGSRTSWRLGSHYGCDLRL